MSDSVRPHRWQPTRLPRPWNSPGKNTGVGCHFLLQCMKVKSESEVAQSCLTLSNPMDCNPPGSSIHRIFQARVLEWGAIAFSEKSSKMLQFNSAAYNFLLLFLIFYFCLFTYWPPCIVRARASLEKGREDFIQGYCNREERPEFSLCSTTLKSKAGHFCTAGEGKTWALPRRKVSFLPDRR